MAAKITVDIEAKVKGYQEAIEQMKAAFAKLDPGTTMAKSIKAGIQSAEAELKNLSRNMFPTASSEGQIDAIINKVNHLGDSIRTTADKMKSLGINDLNLSAIDPQIQQLMGNLDQLQNKFTETISQGMKDTINNSQELSQAFKDLGIQLDNNSTTSSIFEAIITKSEEAKQKVIEMEQAFSKAEKKYNTEVGNLNTLTNNPLFANKDQIDKNLQDIVQNYTNAINRLKPQLEQGLKSLDIKGGEKKREELLNNFLGGLTPENLRTRLIELKNSIQAAAKDTLSASEIYKILLGDTFGKGGNASAIETALIANFFPSNSVFNDIKTNFLQKLSELSTYLTDSQVGNIQGLLSKGQIDTALEKTLQYLQSAYQTLQGKVLKANQEVYDAIEGKDTARANLEAAKTSSSQVDALYVKLQNQVNDLTQKNNDLQKQIEQLHNEIEEKKKASLEQVKQGGARAATQATEQMFPVAQAEAYKNQLVQIAEREKFLGKIEGVVQRWFSVYAAVRMVGQAIRSVISTIKELDKTITEIAIVTNMTQEDLWGQMDKYTDTARKYATSISGVYKVSQLYYQQGLQQADVMALTEQTLKMARISGLEYATATDYMTNAVRSFKMEMQDAQTVVDVYSAIAASSATSVSELASAMSKTASSAQAVGSSFENTTAMMAVMIEATRESAENIGSAMKSIISRYGEMTSDPSKLVDSEGEEMSLNRVDKALQTVGITLHDATGQFRDFDEVIMELAEKWDTIDKNTQRYIATIMAGNRQQSRFLALVSSYDRLKELSTTAAESEDASQLQFLKTLDSIEAKTQQLQTSLQSLYVGAGIETTLKKILDYGNNIVKTFENLGKNNGLGAVISKIGSNFINVALIVTNSFKMIRSRFSSMQQQITAEANLEAAKQQQIAAYQLTAEQEKAQAQTEITLEEAQKRIEIRRQEADAAVRNAERERNANAQVQQQLAKQRLKTGIGITLSTVGQYMATNAAQMESNTEEKRKQKGLSTMAAGALQGAGMFFMMGGGWTGAIMAALAAISSLIEGLGIFSETVSEKVANLSDEIEKASNNSLKAKDELKTLTDYKKKYDELSTTRYLSVENEQEWVKLNNELAENYPSLISYIDAEGNAVVDLENKYDKLLKKKKDAYEIAALEKINANYKALSDMQYVMSSQTTTLANFVSLGRKTDIDTWLNSFVTGASYVPFIGTAISDAYELFTNSNVSNYKNLPETKATDLEKQLNKIASFAQLAGSDKSKFESLVSEYYGGYDYSKFINGTAKVKYNGKIDSQITEAVTQFIQTLDKGYEDYINSANEYIEDTLPELTDYFGEGQEFANYSFLKDRASKELNTAWKQLESQAKSTDEKLKLFKDFYKAIPDAMERFNSRFITFSDDDLQEAEKIFTQKTKFSYNFLSDLANNVSDSVLSLFSAEQIADLQNYALNQLSKIQSKNFALVDSALNKGLIKEEDLQLYKDIASSLSQNLKNIPIQYWEAYSNQFDTILKSSNYKQQDKSNVLQSILGIQNSILFSDKDSATIEAASKLLSEADFTNLLSIFDLSKKLSELGFDFDFSSLIDTIISNIKTELQSFSKKITTNISDFDKAISKATKGMDFKDAAEMAVKLGSRITDFTFRNGKYYFDNLELINQGYLDINKEYTDALQAKITEQNEALKNHFLTIDDKNFDEDIKTNHAEYLESIGINAEVIINKHNQFMQLSKEEREQGFINWLIAENQAEADAIIAASEQYINYSINSGYLTSGNISEFLKSTKAIKDPINYIDQVDSSIEDFDSRLIAAAEIMQQEEQKLTSWIISGYVDELPEELQQYASLIYNTFHSVSSTVANSIISGLEGGETNILVTGINKQALQEAKDAGWIKGEVIEDKLVEIDIDTIKSLEEGNLSFQQWLLDSYTNEADRFKALKSYHKIKYPDISSNLSNIITTGGEISYDAMMDYLESIGLTAEQAANALQDYGLEIAKDEELKISDLSKYIAQLKNDAEKFKDNLEKYNETQAKLYEAEHYQEIQRKETIGEILKSSNSITAKQRGDFATAIGEDFNQVEQFFSEDGIGGFKLDISALKNALDNGTIQVSEQTQAYFNELFAEIADDYLSSISTASSYVTKGTTKQADMQKFVNQYNNLFNLVGAEQLEVADLFDYSDILEAWTLKPEKLREFVKKQAEKLVQKDVDKWIETQTTQAFAQNVNISEFLSDENTDETGKAYKKLTESMREYYKSLSGTIGKSDDEINDIITKEINNLKSGGIEAVKEVKVWASRSGREATTEEIETAFNFAFNELNKAMSQLTDLTIGQITTGELREQLAKAGMVDTNGVVISTSNMVDVYNSIYQKMTITAGNTIAGLNSAYAKVLTAQEQGDIDAVAAMNDAMGMTYEALGQILAKTGNDLETWLNNQDNASMFTKIGAGKIRITNFTAFAQQRGWEPGSEEYTSAFNAYNDSLIALNRKTEKSILEEVQNVISAKAGDQINLTYLTEQLGDTVTQSLATYLSDYGATLENGILTISKDANLVKIAENIKNVAENYSNLLPEELADLADAISNALKSFTEAINNGIAGKLTERGKLDLVSMAKNYLGIDPDSLTFTKTAEGLKLSEKSAISLYMQLKNIDSLQAKLVFDDLNKSLQDNNEHYKGVSEIMARIVELREQIKEAEKTPDETKINQYKEELALAKEILAARSTTEDSSFDFMSNKIPGGQNNPLNYYNSWQSAIKKIQDGAKVKGRKNKTQYAKGYIDYQDFYNIATEMGNLAALGAPIELAGIKLDGSMEKTAQLIQKGAEALTSVDTGELKVDLGKIGLDILGGANSLSDGVDDGIHRLAKAQIKMLDGAIAMLEAIVAMQQIGDIAADGLDINGDAVFDPSDLFSEEGMEKASKYLGWLQKFADVSIDGKGLGESLTELANSGAEGAQKAFDFFDELNKMITNPDYDFTNFTSDFQSLLNKTFGAKSKIDIGKGVFSNLEISSSSMGKTLFDKINTAYDNAVTGSERDSIISQIKKKNKELGTKLEAITKAFPKISLKGAMNIQSLIEEKGTVEKTKNGQYEAKYNGKSLGTFKTKALADAAIRKKAQEEWTKDNKNKDKNKFKPATSTITLQGIQEVAYITETKDGIFTTTYHGVKISRRKREDLQELLKKYMQDFANGNGSFTHKFNGGTVTVKVENGVEYQYYQTDSGNYYIVNGKKYEAENFEAYLKEKGKPENKTVTIDDETSTVTVTTNTGITYQITIDKDGNSVYTDKDGNTYTETQLQTYLKTVAEEKASGSSISLVSNTDGTKTITVTTKNSVVYKIIVSTDGNPQYADENGKIYSNQDAFKRYLEAQKIINNGELEYNDSNGSMTVTIGGQKINITYDVSTGEYTVGDSESASDLKTAIENYNKDNETDITTNEKNKTINIEEGTVTITPDKIVLANISEDGTIALTGSLTTVTATADKLEVTPTKIVKNDENIVPQLQEIPQAIAVVKELLITLGQKEGGQEGEQNISDEVTPVWEEYRKKLIGAGFSEDQATATIGLLKIVLGKTTDSSSGAESNNVENDVEAVWNDLAASLVAGTGMTEDEAKAFVTQLKVDLTNKTPENSEVDTAWENLKTSLTTGAGMTLQEASAWVEKLKVSMGNGNSTTNTNTNSIDTSKVNDELNTALGNLSTKEKSIVLSSVILGLQSNAVKDQNGVVSNSFKEQVKTILEAAGAGQITLDNIDLFIQGFNLVNSLNNNTNELELDPNKVAQLQTLLNNALSEAALSGNISFASLVFNAFTGTPITTDLVSSLINEDGTLNIEALKNLEATATIKKLNLIVDSLANGDGDTNVVTNDNGFTIQVTGATAEVTGISSIDLKNPVVDGKDVELTITNTQGNISTIKVPAKISGVDISSYFDENGNYNGKSLSALVSAIFDAQGLQGKIDAGGPYTIRISPEVMDAHYNSYEDSVMKLYEGRKEKQYTEQDFINAAKTTALDRNKFGYDQYSNGEEYYQELLKSSGNSSLIQKMKESIIEGYNQGLKEIKQKKEKNEPKASEKTQDSSKENKNQPTTTPTETSKAVGAMSKILSNQGLSLDNFTLKDYTNYLKNTETSAEFDVAKARQELVDYLKEIGKIPEDVNTDITTTDGFSNVIEQCKVDLAGLPANQIVNVIVRYTKEGEGSIEATGNVSLATGNALGKGTLMGELGPELVVSHGRYFVVGQNGAEFVNLDDDAIVFNHLQTQSLLKNGKATRGKARTNDKNAVGMAKGNVNGGPAMASAAAALANLKQIRAMWQQLLDASVSDMATKAGGGGGGGKKGAAFMKEVERWYTLMQRIAQLEKDINYQEQLRNKIVGDRNKTGSQYFTSQAKSLTDIAKEVGYQKELALSQEKYFNQRRQELNTRSAFSKLYTFDESGQLVYNDKAKLKNGKKGGLNFLSELFATDTKTGGAKHSDKEKYNMLKSAGLIGSKVYDENGQLIEAPKGKNKDQWNEYYTNVVKAFSAKMDSEKEEMQKLHDSIDDANEKVLELDQQRNEILQDMTDKQLELEEKIMQAVQDSKQAQIDSLQKLRDATEEANQKYLDGLNDALQREQDMYQKNESQNDLDKMRRQLAILQRSGGSASQIASLQNDIRSKEQDQYFEDRQSQIDAIQQASDKQIEKMDAQINIMQKTLDYQIENGLLWKDVSDIMKKSPEEISSYIQKNTKDYMGKSLTDLEQVMKDVTFLAEYWTASKKEQEKLKNKRDVDEEWKGQSTLEWDNDKKKWVTKRAGGTAAALRKQYGDKVWNKAGKKAQEAYYKEYERTGDPRAATEAAEKELIKANGGKKAGETKQPDDKEPKKPTKQPKKDNKQGTKGNKTTGWVKWKCVCDGKTLKSGKWTKKIGKFNTTGAAPKINGYKFKNADPSTIQVQANRTYNLTYTYTKDTTKQPKGKKAKSYSYTAKNGGASISASGFESAEAAKAAATKVINNWLANSKKNAAKSIQNDLPYWDSVNSLVYKRKLNAKYAALIKQAKAAKNSIKVTPQYKTGGLVDYTGIAQVDGTPSKPEAFLNAEQTAILKQGLLGGKNSLVSVLADFQAMLDGSARSSVYNSIDRGGVNIENASVNMNVGSIANDYDARRAGEQALEEMLKIARKTGATSVSRR